MLINPVTIRVSRHVIEHAIDALQSELARHGMRLANRRLSVAMREDLTRQANAVEMAMLTLQDQLSGIDRAAVEG